jgi:hypothetical protein
MAQALLFVTISEEFLPSLGMLSLFRMRYVIQSDFTLRPLKRECSPKDRIDDNLFVALGKP